MLMEGSFDLEVTSRPYAAGAPAGNPRRTAQELRYDLHVLLRHRPPSIPPRFILGQMASAELSRRVGKVVAYPPLSEMDEHHRREFHEALLEAATFEDLPGRFQAGDAPKPAQ
jgi:hypothetical protein